MTVPLVGYELIFNLADAEIADDNAFCVGMEEVCYPIGLVGFFVLADTIVAALLGATYMVHDIHCIGVFAEEILEDMLRLRLAVDSGLGANTDLNMVAEEGRNGFAILLLKCRCYFLGTFLRTEFTRLKKR